MNLVVIILNSLRAKLTMSYMFIVLIAVAIISILSNVMLDHVFKEYVIKQQEVKIDELISRVGEQLNTTNEEWNLSVVENVGMNALSNGLIISVMDKGNRTIWDARTHNNGECQTMVENMAQNMHSRYPNFNGNYVEKKHELVKDDMPVGSIVIGYYGPYYFSDNDLYFINTLNKILAIVAASSVIVSVILGYIMSRYLSIPISSVISISSEIAKGNFGVRVNATSNIKEINSLVATINDLSGTLEHLEKMKKQLTSDVAHELRTPLATLQSHIEAMIDGIWEPDKQRLEGCHSEILRISRMVEDLQELTNIESEKIKLEKSEFELSTFLQLIGQNFEPRFKAKGLLFKFTDNLKGNVIADQDKFSQIMVNLISNAIKYSNSGACIELTTTGDEKSFTITIEDSGIGIPKEDLPFIFERFYRVDKSRGRDAGGAGIGLAIVQALVAAHGGRIIVESEVSKGTKFTLIFPVEK